MSSTDTQSLSLQTRQEQLASDTTHDAAATHVRNVVLIGETGVGKSSLINLVAGERIAQTSNNALGCTLEPNCYDVAIPFDDGDSPESGSVVNVTMWDTAGMEEGTYGAVPADAAAARLRVLLHTLARSPSGVHLLLFCIRGTSRLTRELARQYNLVYASMCHKKVSIALVVTGLEHLYPDEPAEGMEHWWTAHEGELAQLGMVFNAHACVTTKHEGIEAIEQERRITSRRQLRELVVKYACRETNAWRIGPSWGSVVVSRLTRLSGGLVRFRRAFGFNGEDEGDTSGFRRYYASLKLWLANLVVTFITGRNSALLRTIT